MRLKLLDLTYLSLNRDLQRKNARLRLDKLPFPVQFTYNVMNCLLFNKLFVIKTVTKFILTFPPVSISHCQTQ